MNLIKDSTLDLFQTRRGARGVEVAAFAAGAAIVVLSAILAKEAGSAPLLASVESSEEPRVTQVAFTPESAAPIEVVEDETPAPAFDAETRWFDGRPVRPARTIEMLVTAYSPHAASCGQFADGQTATLHSVRTNGGALVAADTSVLPYGSMLTIDGYAADGIVPVLDCGGAIKGNRLDLLFPTHEEALAWGVRRIEVVVWEYADGKPAPNPRRVR
ncbi:MAG: 3D domain-containing protein [Phycisphaerales bacterium JB059]